MTHFCTLFNKSYLHYGVALYNSIENNSNGDFHLFVLAMDEDTFDFLNTNSFNKITCISLNDFEDDDLKLVKLKRSFGEYCWTCTPSLIKFCLEKFKIPECIYLDADLYFYSDPSIGWKEMPENYSIFLTEHNYHPKHDKRFYNGMYCVQYVGFRNNVSGLNALNWWKQSCLNWCYAKYENGKFGDQKYLDDWLTRFDEVWVSKNKGLGLAPWNTELFNISKNDKKLYIEDKITKEIFLLTFYHFHAIKFYNNKIKLSEYEYIINDDVRSLIYKPYIQILSNQIDRKFKEHFSYIKTLFFYLIFIKKTMHKLFFDKSENPFNNIINY